MYFNEIWILICSLFFVNKGICFSIGNDKLVICGMFNDFIVVRFFFKGFICCLKGEVGCIMGMFLVKFFFWSFVS